MKRAFSTLKTAQSNFRLWLLSQQWFTSKLLPAIPRPIRWALRKLFFLPGDLIEWAFGLREDLVPPTSMIYTGEIGDFKAGGLNLVRRVTTITGITPEAKILDIGCGMGRFAVGLTSYLNENGRYDGLDIVKDAIEWNNGNIATRYPNFHFTHADIYNKEYNPHGQVQASEYKFPFPDATFDLITLHSIFTHLLPTDTEHYIAEISRMLKKGGHCYATYSLLNDETQISMDAGKSILRFKRYEGPSWVVGTQVPELAVGYDESYILDLYARNNLAGTVHYGKWVERPSLGKEPEPIQDIVVGVKQ